MSLYHAHDTSRPRTKFPVVLYREHDTIIFHVLKNIWRAKIYQVGTQFAKVLEGTMIKCELRATRKIFGGRKFLLHRDFFLLHRAREILYKKKGEKVRVRNIVPIVVNHS